MNKFFESIEKLHLCKLANALKIYFPTTNNEETLYRSLFKWISISVFLLGNKKYFFVFFMKQTTKRKNEIDKFFFYIF